MIAREGGQHGTQEFFYEKQMLCGYRYSFGFILTACDNGTTSQPKSLTITGIPAGRTIHVRLKVPGTENVTVAGAYYEFKGSEQDITFPLITGENYDDPGDNHVTGTGDYVIWVDFLRPVGNPRRRFITMGGVQEM